MIVRLLDREPAHDVLDEEPEGEPQTGPRTRLPRLPTEMELLVFRLRFTRWAAKYWPEALK